MQLPANPFKHALRQGKLQIGLWVGLANAYTAEICAGAGFDWLLFDGEHAPNDVPLLLSQLQAAAPYPSHPVARLPIGDARLIKQYLDLGFASLLIPMVETPEQARDLVAATRYPPQGMRGVGSALARASRWNRISDYLPRANDEICLLLQIESLKGLENLDAMATLDGVDGVFIGPSDLAASMGHLGNPAHPDVQRVIEEAIARILKHGKAAGILSASEPLNRRYIELGALFVAVGVDTTLLARATSELRDRYGPPSAPAAPSDTTY